MLRLSDAAFLAGIVLALFVVRHVRVSDLFTAPRRRPSRSSSGPNWLGDERRDRRDIAYFRRRDGQVGPVPDSHLAALLTLRPTPIHALLHAGIINAGGFLLNQLAPAVRAESINAYTWSSSSAC